MAYVHIPAWRNRAVMYGAGVVAFLALAACNPSESDSIESEVFVTQVGEDGAAYAIDFLAGGDDGVISDASFARVWLDDYRDHTEDPVVVSFVCDFGDGPSPRERDIRTTNGELVAHEFRQAYRIPFEVPCTLRFDKIADVPDAPDVTLEWHIEAGLTVSTRKDIFLELEIHEL